MSYHIFFQQLTLLLYKLDTLLLKQKNLLVLDITGFFFRIRTHVTALSFVSKVLYPMHKSIVKLCNRPSLRTSYIALMPLSAIDFVVRLKLPVFD